MKDRTSSKPQWLIALHAHLRARPVLRALYWAVACFLFFQAWHLVQGDAITPKRLLVDVLAWAISGVFFFTVMRWWESNHAR